MAAKNEKEIAVSIPLEDVEKIEIYLNKSRKALSTIIGETGAAYAINGTLYKMSNGKPVCPLKSNGVTLYQGRYTYRGYVWENFYPQSFHFGLVPNDTWSNYIACTHIVMDGTPVKKPVYNIARTYRDRHEDRKRSAPYLPVRIKRQNQRTTNAGTACAVACRLRLERCRHAGRRHQLTSVFRSRAQTSKLA